MVVSVLPRLCLDLEVEPFDFELIIPSLVREIHPGRHDLGHSALPAKPPSRRPSTYSAVMAQDRLTALLVGGTLPQPRPLYAGAVLGVDCCGVAELRSAGFALQYADRAGTRLPAAQAQPMTMDTIFDLASVSKVFTATLASVLSEQGLFSLDDPVGDYLPSFAVTSRSTVTIRHLLAHTSGLPAESTAWQRSPRLAAQVGSSVRAAVLAEPLTHPPGTHFCYSCVGFVVLGALVESASGQPLDRLVRDQITAPLAMSDTGFVPTRHAAHLVGRIAATELPDGPSPAAVGGTSTDRRGIVHDETAAALGGVAGNAGLFSSTKDLLRFGRCFLDLVTERPSPLGLTPTGARATVSAQAPPEIRPDFTPGLGFRIDDRSFMGELASTATYGHPGFTGTALIIDEHRDLVVALMTNRVHPSRHWSELNPWRRQLCAVLARERPTFIPG